MPAYFVEFLSQCSEPLRKAWEGWMHDRLLSDPTKEPPVKYVESIIRRFISVEYDKSEVVCQSGYLSDNGICFLIHLTKQDADLYMSLRGEL